ncbi:MAG: tetratricopeptide repeat protein [Porphyromonadaceae bacterium]|nr:tetratricopeptide repeat protein [Porphyromonadaceae bacterium]
MSSRQILFIALMLVGIASTDAQVSKRQQLRKGNKLYEKSDFGAAEASYRSLLQQDSLSTYANFAIGNTLYKQGKGQEARSYYEQAAKQADLPKDKEAQIWHNLGNISMQEKQYAKAIEAYEQSLILNPSDDETRYNLVLAQKLLQQEQQQNKNDQQQSQDDQQNKQDQNKDQQQNQEQNKDKQKQDQQKNQQKPQEQKPDKQNPEAKNPAEPQAGEGKMSRQQAEQILDAYKQNDDKTRQRVEQMQREGEEKRNHKVKRKW